CRSQFKRFDD
ncbi:Phage-related minor tail protein, partial [Haemophilus influenzae]